MCLDLGVRPALNDCLVYSFGVGDDWTFDDDMAKLGCQVYAFDPFVDFKDHNRGDHIHFYQWGLWHVDDIIHDKNDTKEFMKLRTLSSLYDELKRYHGDRPIDYVKIDVDGTEWSVLPVIMASGILNNVKQLAIEIHFTLVDRVGEVRERLKMLKKLEHEHGMIPFDYQPNLGSLDQLPAAPKRYSCAEIAYFNSKFHHLSN